MNLHKEQHQLAKALDWDRIKVQGVVQQEFQVGELGSVVLRQDDQVGGRLSSRVKHVRMNYQHRRQLVAVDAIKVPMWSARISWKLEIFSLSRCVLCAREE